MNFVNSLKICLITFFSIGKAIDVIAEECKLRNCNNQINSTKLRLFIKESKDIISDDMSIKMLEILNRNQIVDGDSLYLGYVPN